MVGGHDVDLVASKQFPSVMLWPGTFQAQLELQDGWPGDGFGDRNGEYLMLVLMMLGFSGRSVLALSRTR